jgi:hypothetical protein
MGRVPLLARRLAIGFQYRIDELNPMAMPQVLSVRPKHVYGKSIDSSRFKFRIGNTLLIQIANGVLPLLRKIRDAVTRSRDLHLAGGRPDLPGRSSLRAALTGQGQGSILINGTKFVAGSTGPGLQPVSRGQYIQIYATGVGKVQEPGGTPPPGDGQPARASSPIFNTVAIAAVTIGGVNAPVSFAGLAPGFVALYQVNVQLPPNAPTGPRSGGAHNDRRQRLPGCLPNGHHRGPVSMFAGSTRLPQPGCSETSRSFTWHFKYH